MNYCLTNWEKSNMKYVLCSMMYRDIGSDMKKMKVPQPVSGHKFQTNLLKGLKDNGLEVMVLNIPLVRYFPHFPQILFKSKDYIFENSKCGTNVGFINLPILNYITQFITLKRVMNRYINKNANERIVFISYNNYLPISLALKHAKKSKNVISCNVVADMYGKFSVDIANRNKGIIGRLREIIEKKQNELSTIHDTYALLTKYMAEPLGIIDRPYVIVEGMYSENSKTEKIVSQYNFSKKQTKDIFYAGSVGIQYGLKHLLKAFSLIEDHSYRLYIAGNGDAADLVKNCAALDERITYLGYITPNEVEQYQRSATVLVNPRTSEYEFVKYSFPSKNMECLASGKPYIAHDLICDPVEYHCYMQCPVDESDEALARKIVEVCSLTEEERNKIGEKARQFILTEKSPKKQCKKIVDMINNLKSHNKMYGELIE